MLGRSCCSISALEELILEILDDYSIGRELYEADAVEAVTDCLNSHFRSQGEWQLGYAHGVCFASWIENDNLHMISFDYKNI
jgi:hypothetical protein